MNVRHHLHRVHRVATIPVKPHHSYFALAVVAFAAGFLLNHQPTVEASNQTQLVAVINPGAVGSDIVDSSGNPVANPSVTMSSSPFSFDPQTATGTLGTSSQRVRVTNATNVAAWSLTIAATSGNTSLWSSGSNTMDFNDTGTAGRLTIDASGSTVTPTNTYTNTGLTKGSLTSFTQGTTDSITLLSASSSADRPGRWDIMGVALSQYIPAYQAPGSYTINMSLTVA